MCGICGVLRYDGAPVDPASVIGAAHSMKHRGPDGEGYLLFNTATGEHSPRSGPDTPPDIPYPPATQPPPFTPDLVLAHRRLSILDLSSAGHEPFGSGDLWITFNGEIYNFLEIREVLRAKGYEFHTECDVEVILQSYREWGLDCLERFVGMFAFVLWDQTRRRLWCVRDRFGVKPLYYASTPTTFAFASEMKALRILTPEAYRPDMSQLAWFLHYGSVYNAPQTFFEGIQELPGAHYLLVENGRPSAPVRWWDVDLERSRAAYDYRRPEEELLRLMRESVKLRLRSDVPVGTCLSGGLDSSTIVALATAQLNGGRMNSFSAVYPTPGLDETRFVDIVATRFNTIEHKVTPGPEGYLDRISKITWHQDIPTGTSGVYTQNFVMELAHGAVTVLLDGQGADELFAGYLSHVVAHLTALRRERPTRWVREQLAFAAGVWPRFGASLNWREFGARVTHYLKSGRRPAPYLVPDFIRAADARQSELPPSTLPGSDGLNEVLYRSLMRDSVPALLHYEDRNSMAHSIEARVPFLDHRVVEFAMGVPAELKVRGADTKVIMRRAMRDVLPREIAQRKDKLGYPTPFGQWLRGPLATPIHTFLEDTAFKRPWYDVARLRALWLQHQSRQRNAEQLFHRIITAELWYRNVSGSKS